MSRFKLYIANNSVQGIIHFWWMSMQFFQKYLLHPTWKIRFLLTHFQYLKLEIEIIWLTNNWEALNLHSGLIVKMVITKFLLILGKDTCSGEWGVCSSNLQLLGTVLPSSQQCWFAIFNNPIQICYKSYCLCLHVQTFFVVRWLL